MIREIKQKIFPIQFYEREFKIKFPHTSKNWISIVHCPFHPDKRKGSFFIHLKSGAFKCFSCGASGGDIISYICKQYSLTIPYALERLKNEYY